MFDMMGHFCVTYAAVPEICSYVGSCWLFISFIKDIEKDLTILRVKKSSRKKGTALTARFSEIVQEYSEVKQLSVLPVHNV